MSYRPTDPFTGRRYYDEMPSLYAERLQDGRYQIWGSFWYRDGDATQTEDGPYERQTYSTREEALLRIEQIKADNSTLA